MKNLIMISMVLVTLTVTGYTMGGGGGAIQYIGGGMSQAEADARYLSITSTSAGMSQATADTLYFPIADGQAVKNSTFPITAVVPITGGIITGELTVPKIIVTSTVYITDGSTQTFSCAGYNILSFLASEQSNSTTQTSYQSGTEGFNTVPIFGLGINTTTVTGISLCGTIYVKGSTSSVANTGTTRLRLRTGTNFTDTTGGDFYYLTKSANSNYVDGFNSNSAVAYELTNSTNVYTFIDYRVDITTITNFSNLRGGITCQGKSGVSGKTMNYGRSQVDIRIKSGGGSE